MRVEPELVDHPKYLKLKRRIGDVALECLLRLWGHCQASQRGGTWKNADFEYVEIVARWTGKPGEFYEAAKESGWIDERSGSIIIHDWDHFNSKARANWANGKVGGKPVGLTQSKPTEPVAKVGLTQTKPNANPTVTHSEPSPVESIESIESQSVGTRGLTEVQVPSLSEYVAACELRGVSKDFAEADHAWRSERPQDRWPLGSNWQTAVTTTATRYRQRGVVSGKNGGGGGGESVQQKIYRLDQRIKELTIQAASFEDVDPVLCKRLETELEAVKAERLAL